MERRTFIKTAGTVTVVTCLCGTTFNSCKMLTGISRMPTAPASSFFEEGNIIKLQLVKVPELQNVGSAIKLKAGENKIAVVHLSEGQFIAFENRCTHGGRELNYLPDEQKIRCSSFGHSRYNIEGEVEKGPAPEPLTLYKTNLSENELTIQRG